MNTVDDAILKFLALRCETAIEILSRYYQFHGIPKISHFLLPLSETTEISGRVLFEEIDLDFFIGIQFGSCLCTEILNSEFISIHQAAVIAEESSHFQLISDAVKHKSQISILELEVLGEIDRFLCLMHWNQWNLNHQIKYKWKNIHQICDAVFQGDRFQLENPDLYVKAEHLAFRHLKNAFSDEWDSTNYDFSNINPKASRYLSQFRQKVLSIKER
jgi:hypothetical protein